MSEKPRKAYVNFVKQVRISDKAVTLTWFVLPLRSQHPLGVVKWHAPWRRYCFFPTQGTLYDAACLNDISNFCRDETAKRKEARRQELLTPVEKQHEGNADWQERMLNLISP